MKIKFTKMEGCGNDYIYIEDFSHQINNHSDLTKKLADRHFGVGGDGVIYIQESNCADAKMSMYNEDGSEGLMCGNGIRCVAKYLYDRHIVNSHSILIETLSGIKKVDLIFVGDDVVGASVNMGKAELAPSLIPVKLEGKQVVDRPVAFEGQLMNITCVNMGNPHCIIFSEDLKNLDIQACGSLVEHSTLFPDRTNVEFVRMIDACHLQMRVWERGAGETLACGTGACASVVASVENGYCKKGDWIQVSLKGGDLQIKYTDEYVLMQGPAKTAFEGFVEI